MALSEYQPIRVAVDFKGGSFQVRGLSLDDITAVLGDHLNDMNHIINLYHKEVDPRIHLIEGAGFILNLVKDAPALTAQLIAHASDEPECAENARKLPLPIQIDAMRKIANLTFEEYGGLKKFIESLQEMAGKFVPAMTTTDSDTLAPLN